FLDYCGGLCSEFICSLFRVIPGDASGRRLLSLTGDSLRGFWISLSRTIMGVLQDIFAEGWNVLTNQFSVLLGPGEESSSAVLCVGDFISARDKAGVPGLAASGMRVRRTARRSAVSHVTEVTSGSSVAGVVSVSTPPPPSSSEMLVLAREEEVEVSEVGLPIVGAAVADLGVLEGESSGMTVVSTTSASPVTISVFEVEEFSTVPRIGSSGGPVAPKKLFMSMYRSGVTSSSGMSSSSTSSGSIVSSGPLSSVSIATSIGSTLATTTGTASGGGDIGDRLAALLNRGLPPSPPPVSESAPTGGEASSSSRGSVRARRKRKRRN
ncbi:hypothetical protein, partial [Candidatus Ichthyocystis hellenicum]|uniref:hypothetical protein n=3 Tax=Candidatus Ichthyocystis TaxID=2929841 RepID=UPI001F5FB7DB